MAALLDVSDLKAFYGPVQVLFGLDFVVEEGGVTALLGANGAGKTSTLRALSGLIRRSGRITFGGHRIDDRSTEAISRLGIAHVPEGRGTFTGLTTEENLQLGAYLCKDRRRVAEDLERVYHYFPRLKERRTQQAGTLSGGEQQMLALSRAFMLQPRLMLLDEPSFGLSPLLVEEIFAILDAMNKEQNVSMLLVEQNAAIALELADHAYLVETGRMVISGTAAAIGSDDTIRRSYLGY